MESQQWIYIYVCVGLCSWILLDYLRRIYNNFISGLRQSCLKALKIKLKNYILSFPCKVRWFLFLHITFLKCGNSFIRLTYFTFYFTFSFSNKYTINFHSFFYNLRIILHNDKSSKAWCLLLIVVRLIINMKQIS